MSDRPAGYRCLAGSQENSLIETVHDAFAELRVGHWSLSPDLETELLVDDDLGMRRREN
jgi:hypothetical protein